MFVRVSGRMQEGGDYLGLTNRTGWSMVNGIQRFALDLSNRRNGEEISSSELSSSIPIHVYIRKLPWQMLALVARVFHRERTIEEKINYLTSISSAFLRIVELTLSMRTTSRLSNELGNILFEGIVKPISLFVVVISYSNTIYDDCNSNLDSGLNLYGKK